MPGHANLEFSFSECARPQLARLRWQVDIELAETEKGARSRAGAMVH